MPDSRFRWAIAAFFVFLLSWAVVLARWADPVVPAAPLEPRWVRTSDGWQIAEWEQPTPPPHRPTLHPLVVAGFVTLASTAALVALSQARRGR